MHAYRAYTHTETETEREKIHFIPSDVPNEQDTNKIAMAIRKTFNRHLSTKNWNWIYLK